jgi:hypothetical protein
MLKQSHRVTTAINNAMPQLSKLIRSRDEWRNKAVLRATEIREHRKTEKRNKEKIAELKKQMDELKQVVEDNKKNS